MSQFKNTLSDALREYWVNFAGWGRATRTEYWFATFIYGCVIGTILSPSDLALLWTAVTLVPSFCVGARRLHDTGRSNWNICWAFLPIIGWIILLVFMCQKGSTSANKYGPARLK